MNNETPIKLPSEYDKEEYKEFSKLVEIMTKHNQEKRISWEDLRKNEYIKILLDKY